MRGDVALTSRLLLRRSGIAGVVVALGGAAAVVAATRPWYHAVAEVAMLGREQARAVASLPGVPGTWMGWAALVCGVGAVLLGVAVAVDRPPAPARLVLLGLGAVVLGVGVAALLGPAPDVARIAGGDGTQLVSLGQRLPSGVGLDLRVGRGIGAWLAAIGGGMVVVGTLSVRDL